MFKEFFEIDISDMITGEKFVGVCDNLYYHYDRNLNFSIRDSDCIFYSDTYFVDDLFRELPRNRRVIVVSHNADKNVDLEFYKKCMIENCITWFSQNVISNCERLVCLPIGLENSRWFIDEKKKEKILERRKKRDIPTKLLYLNFAVQNNRAAREEPLKIFEGKDWATIKNGCNGFDFDGYIKDVDDHFYILSPEGNGADCHRTWEALYMQRVPILIKNEYTKVYDDLPVLIIDSWNDITREMLEEKKEFFLKKDFDFKKIKFQYWKELIQKELLS